MKVLIVDDEIRIRDCIREYCQYEGFEAYEAEDGKKALEIFEAIDIDLIVLDIMMPNMDGFTAFQEMKKKKSVPTIVLSARGEEYDKLFGFELGIDDYMTKPFSPKELIARMKAVHKRTYPEKDQFIYQDLMVDKTGRVIKIEDEEIKVTPKEYELLIYFIQNKGMAISREQLLNKIWGYDFYGDNRTVDTHIKMLRNSLGKYRDLIITIHGMGYKFELPEEK